MFKFIKKKNSQIISNPNKNNNDNSMNQDEFDSQLTLESAINANLDEIIKKYNIEVRNSALITLLNGDPSKGKQYSSNLEIYKMLKQCKNRNVKVTKELKKSLNNLEKIKKSYEGFYNEISNDYDVHKDTILEHDEHTPHM